MIAKIQALNPAGWGPFSPVNGIGATISNTLPKIPDLIKTA